MSKNCKTCKNYQEYYVKNDGKFFLTNRGYCCLKGATTNCDSCCVNYVLIEKEKKYSPITKENVENVILYLNKLLENIGIVVDKKDVGKCKNFDENTPYNNKIE